MTPAEYIADVLEPINAQGATLTWSITPQSSDTIIDGDIIGTSPLVGEKIAPDAHITIFESTGPAGGTIGFPAVSRFGGLLETG